MASPDRSRSRSPRKSKSPDGKRRSRSPERRRSPPRKPRGGGGFKWKDKSNRDHRRDDGRDDRRGRYGSDVYRPKRYMDDRSGRDGRDGRDRNEYRSSGRDFRDREEASKEENSSKNKRNDSDQKTGAKMPTKPSSTAPTSSASATFITVFVNDRLGTKAQIPCLPSDTIGDFKKIVAANIGRKPHEIMLKRQGERPFKDHITLGDYEISNGVQLDLELDTGD